MNTLLLMAAILPIALGGLLRWLPVPAARRLMQAALLPLVLLAVGIWLHPTREPLMPQWRLFSMLVALVFSAFAYRWLQGTASWPFVKPSLMMLLAFIVLLLLKVRTASALVLLANLPALLLHCSALAFEDRKSDQPAGLPRYAWRLILSPAAPAGVLAVGSVLAACLLHAPSAGQMTLLGGTALGIVVACLVWQLLLHILAGQPDGDLPTSPSSAKGSELNWLFQRQVRLASTAAILLALLRLRPLMNQSPFGNDVLLLLAAGLLIVVGSQLLMERRVAALLSLMEYVWMGGLLAVCCAPAWPSTEMLRQYLVWVIGFMALNGWMLRRLVDALGPRINLDTIAGWRFTRIKDAIGLSLVILFMQFMPVLPATHYWVVMLARLAVHHLFIALFWLMAIGAMLVAAFRLWAAMYLPGKPAHCK
jgi:hypothetical protein